MYDAFGQLEQAKVNNSILVSHDYDDVGRLERSDFGNNQYQEFLYNSLSRLEELRLDGIPRFAFDYDARGNMVYYKDLVSGDETRVTYDLADRPQVVTQENRRLTFAYDKNNNTTAVNDRLGTETFTTGYAFTPDNLVEGVTTPAGKDVRIFFDGQGRINRYLYPLTSGKLFTQYAYNEQGLLSVLDNNEDSYRYIYDAKGNITGIERNGESVSYDYDEFSRLISVTEGNDTTTFDYDDGNNLIEKDDGTQVTEYDYIEDRLETITVKENGQVVDTRILDYDDGGNLVDDEVFEYEWEGGRYLAGITGASTDFSYSYNPSGLRVKKENNDTLQKVLLRLRR